MLRTPSSRYQVVVYFDLSWQRTSREDSARGKEDLKRLEDHARLILPLGGKIRGKEADHTQTRHLLGRAWKWIMCWDICLHAKLGGALQMELEWVCFGELCSSQNAEVRQEWHRCVWKVGSQNSSY